MAEPANRDRFLVSALRDLAAERGIELSSFCHDWILRLERGGRVSHVWGYDFALNSAAAQLIAGDKAATSALLGGLGIPHVEHRLLIHPREASYVGSAGNWSPTLAWAEKLAFRVVVKPNEGSGGREVCRVGSALELEATVHRLFERHRSLALSPFIEIESETRCVMLGGEPLLVYAKERPTVEGDGRSTTPELILAQLGAAGFESAELASLDLARVPAVGERVLLRWKHNLGAGATPRDLPLGPDREPVIALARRALRSLNVELASIDLVLVAGELAVLEVNTGIMLESYARSLPDGATKAKAIYGEILRRIFGSGLAMSPTRLWLDTDLALGTASGDVDDGFALAAVLASPGVELLGISAVAGNTDAASAEAAIHALLDAAGIERGSLPVVGPREAPKRIAALPRGTRVVALGPLGNVMRAVTLDPELPSRVSVSAVATVLRPLRHPIWGFFCLNTRADRCSARAFLATPWLGRRIFPLDVVQRLRIGSRDLDRLSTSSPLGNYLAAHSRRWLAQAWWRYRARTFPVWDLVAALDAAGELPGARFTADGERLASFDAAAARRRFLALLSSAPAAAR